MLRSSVFQKAASDRRVRCYHCRANLLVPASAGSASCPSCHKQLVLDDLIVKDAAWSTRLVTCGRVFIERKGRATIRHVGAGEGIEVKGMLDARVISGGPVVVTPGAVLKGECQATSLWVDPGGVLEGVTMRIGPEVEDVPLSPPPMVSTRGTIPAPILGNA